jgi:brefeldin A-inhibited guanine nucleotide-exchange protein
MFKVFSAASHVLTGTSFAFASICTDSPSARVPNYAFDLVTTIYREHFDLVLKYGSFSDFCVCLTDFSKVTKFQKISLQAIGMLQGTVPKLLESPESTTKPYNEEQTDGKLAPGADDKMARYWFPVLFAFYDIIMTGEDLEVRRM